MVKAAAGGGGRGMRRVTSKGELAAALAAARAEAISAFGSGDLILERMVADARHVEIQLLADAHGSIVHLGERDCSVQRRHQKLLEEAPSPAVDAGLRERMGAAAIAAARAVGYTSAGTVEFLLAPDGTFYFLEMNTRLQVEHPVTECVTGLDLVALQLRIAAGEPLPFGQADVRLGGHAIEARLCAEAPHMGFLPQSGELVAWRPPSGAGIRVDHGLDAGQAVSPFYDSLLAKIIAHGATREQARRRLVGALRDTVALGLATNRAFLVDCLETEAFAAGQATTELIAGRFPGIAAPAADAAALALAAALLFEASARKHGHDPARAWSTSGPLSWPMRLEAGGTSVDRSVTVLGPRRYRVGGGPSETIVELLAGGAEGALRYRLDGREGGAFAAVAGEGLHLAIGAADLSVRDTLYAPRTATAAGPGSQTELRAPMSGKVVAVLAAEGESVAKGQRLVVVEAMKMQHEMTAQAAGRVVRLAVRPGDQVTSRQLLVELEPA
jgi:geranyl-CoA carboxylase alpha subunit